MTTAILSRFSGGESNSKKARVLKRVGAAGFMFFLVKGLLWLLVPAAIWLFGS